jgi:hypothetical protein
MKRFLLVALAAAALGSSSGCCRGWLIAPGHYPHNPSFSQCCDPPWGPPDPFRGRPPREQGWGRGPHAPSEAGQECYYSSAGIGDLLGHGDCGCGLHGHRGHSGAQGYGGPSGPGGYGPGPAGVYGPVSPEGILLQAAPDAMSAAQVAYPYYTNRGPRDFLMGYPPGTQPPSIGP